MSRRFSSSVSARSTFLQFARSGSEAELKCAAEVLQHAEPVAKAGTVALVHDHQIEEVRIVMLVDLLAVELLIKVLVVGEEDLADKMLPLRDRRPYRSAHVQTPSRRRRRGRPDP